jgi:hypothetical protein
MKIARIRFPDGGRFENASMQEFDYLDEFDMVISLFGTFNYLIEDNDIEKALWNTWRALKPGGIGLFEVWNSFPIERIREKPLGRISTTDYNNSVISRDRGFRIIGMPPKTVVEVNYLYKIQREDSEVTVTDKHFMRAFSRKEMEYFLTDNGFIIKEFYAGTNREIYNETSNRMIIHFRK